jgi:hypothetical protein
MQLYGRQTHIGVVFHFKNVIKLNCTNMISLKQVEEVSRMDEKFKCCNAYRHSICLAEYVDHFFYGDVLRNIGKIPSCPHCRALLSDWITMVEDSTVSE